MASNCRNRIDSLSSQNFQMRGAEWRVCRNDLGDGEWAIFARVLVVILLALAFATWQTRYKTIQEDAEERRMVGGWGICGNDWWDACYEVCEDADFNAAFKDGEFNVEGSYFVGKALLKAKMVSKYTVKRQVRGGGPTSQNPSRAQPAAQYIPSPGVPICDVIDERIIICPDLCLLMWGNDAFTILRGPK